MFSKQNPEAKSLAEFHAFWSKPFDQIIDDLYHYVPEAIFQFHTRMRKANPEDIAIAQKKINQLSEKEEKKESNSSKLTKVIIDNLKHYISASSPNRASLNGIQLVRKILIAQALMQYNMMYKISPNDHELFYIAFLNMNSLDIWNIHIQTELVHINKHFEKIEERDYIFSHHPNYLYCVALQSELSRTLFEERNHEIFFPPLGFPDIENFQHVNPLDYYRKALEAGSELALTGLARLYAKGAYVEKNVDFAIDLYRMALKRNVIGALPLDNGDPRILYYSTLVSGMNSLGVDHFSTLSRFNFYSSLEAYWIMRMNYADPALLKALQKFEKLALKNPKNIFDTLVDENSRSFERLRLCVSPTLYDTILKHKKSFFSTHYQLLKNKCYPDLAKHILTFSAPSECLENIKKLPPQKIDIMKFFSYNHHLFKTLEKMNDDLLKENHHENQEAFDRRFGLIVKR